MIGRKQYLDLLNKNYQLGKSSIVVVYGRRRIGKSYLITEYLKDKPHFKFEGIEKQTSKAQINSLQLALDLQNNALSWEEVLLKIPTDKYKNKNKKKFCLFFDEFQWMACGKTLLPALIKKIWDNKWLYDNVQLILCGSVSSYMVGQVIKSKALYGRIGLEIKVDSMPTTEAVQFFTKYKSHEDIFKSLVIFGGVPKYLSELDQRKSLEENLSNMLFNKYSPYINEYSRIFYSQFKEYQTYEKIVFELSQGSKNLIQIADKLKVKSGGGLKSYLTNLSNAQFITANSWQKKIIQYKLTDPFLRFYFNYIYGKKEKIENAKTPLQAFNQITKDSWESFLGLAFENYCLVNAMEIAELLNISELVCKYGQLNIINEAQIDLLFVREDKSINVVEIKFQKNEIKPSIIIDMEKKIESVLNLYPDYSIYKNLITLSNPSKALIASEYFDKIITVADWISDDR